MQREKKDKKIELHQLIWSTFKDKRDLKMNIRVLGVEAAGTSFSVMVLSQSWVDRGQEMALCCQWSLPVLLFSWFWICCNKV